jgi:hypothetical protein
METCSMAKLDAENTIRTGLEDLLWRFKFFSVVERLAWYSGFSQQQYARGGDKHVKFRVLPFRMKI